MTLLSVPPLDEEPWPTLGPQVVAFLEDRATFGPGSLKGQPAKLDAEKKAIIYRAYEVYPRGHRREGRRRFQRIGISLPKGSSKTELLAWLAFAELHSEGPVRFDGWDAHGQPVGRPVADPYIPLVGVSEEQTEELAYGALYVVCTEGPDADLFDVGLDRIIRLDEYGRADGKATALAAAPNSRDGARTTFEGFDEPLALDTPVPTTAGWRTIGELNEGDEVFDRHGRAVKVLGASPVHVGRRCYRVTFGDGTSVITDASHRWKAVEWSNKPAGERVVTTEQMLERGVETRYGYRWRLPRNRGVDGARADLPIDPYLLGLWLGDGATDAGYLHCDPSDYDELSADIEHTMAAAQSGKSAMRWLPTGLRAKLRAAGLLGDKHIPMAYQLASREQRIALLQGLMDTDGHTTCGGSCTFVQKYRALCEQVAALVRSLGVQASVRAYADPRSRTGEMVKVHFSPDFAPFRLTRKTSRFTWGTRSSTRWPTIVSIDLVDSVPVRCIAVDNDDHLFVVGHGFQLTHNTHRLYLPRVKEAHQTMLANLTKRPLDDPWHAEVTTAGHLGQGSIAEDTHAEALAIERGEYDTPDLLYHHREAGPQHALYDEKGRLAPLAARTAAVAEARGGVGEYAPGQFEDIARQWDRPKADHHYLERVWLNRWVSGQAQAFNMQRWSELARPGRIEPGELVTLGFDGAKFRDATAFVATDVATGVQQCIGLWERPLDLPDEAEWEVPLTEVWETLSTAMARWQVWKVYADPPHWVETVAQWAAHWPDQVEEWWTNRPRPMAYAVRDFREAMAAGELRWAADAPLADAYSRHVGNAGRQLINQWHDDGSQLFILQKVHVDRKFDAGMAGVLSWQARLEALRKGAKKKTRRAPSRVR